MALEPSTAAEVTRREAADRLDLTERQVDRLIRDDVLRAVKVGHKVRVTVESLEAELKRREPTPIVVRTAEVAA